MLCVGVLCGSWTHLHILITTHSISSVRQYRHRQGKKADYPRTSKTHKKGAPKVVSLLLANQRYVSLHPPIPPKRTTYANRTPDTSLVCMPLFSPFPPSFNPFLCPNPTTQNPSLLPPQTPTQTLDDPTRPAPLTPMTRPWCLTSDIDEPR